MRGQKFHSKNIPDSKIAELYRLLDTNKDAQGIMKIFHNKEKDMESLREISTR